MTAFLDSITRTLVPAFLGALWQGLLLVALTEVALRLLKANASTRYAVWFAVLLFVAVLPAFALLPADRPATAVHSIPASTQAVPVAVIPLLAARIAVLIWAAVSLLRLAQIAIGLRQILIWKRTAHFAGTLRNLPRKARICSSERCESPVVIGFFRPVILVPSWMAHSMTSSELNQILCHEAAHLSRYDDATQLIQRIAEALFFFHPGVHWIGRRLALEREIACDDHVVSSDSGGRAYARCLIRLVERSAISTAPVHAPAIFSDSNHLKRRIDMLLSRNRDRSTRVTVMGIALVMFLFAGLFLLAQAPPVAAVSAEERAATHETMNRIRQSSHQARREAMKARAESLKTREQMKRAAEEMQRTSEEMRRASEEMERAAEQMRAITENSHAGRVWLDTPATPPALAPLPELPAEPFPVLAPRPPAQPEAPRATDMPSPPAPVLAPRPPAQPEVPRATEMPSPPAPVLAPRPPAQPEAPRAREMPAQPQ